MSSLLTFVNNHKKELVQIYITERQKNGGLDGVLEIIKITNDKVDVRYLIISQMNPKLILEILEKKKENNNPKQSLIYFYLCDAINSLLIEIDLEEEIRSN
jgi:hypothetical protein